MAIAENLLALHRAEEEIRATALRAITGDSVLSDHLQAVHDGLDHLTALVRLESEPGSSRHTLQLLAIRLLNNAASVLKLGLSGYYQTGFQLMREMLELVNLVDLFSVEQNKLDVWRTADDKTHRQLFDPVKVRVALEKHSRFAGHRRDGLYKTFSSYAAHPTYKGFQLIAPGNSPKIGCFFDKKLLGALLYEEGRHLSHATLGLSMLFNGEEDELLLAKSLFLEGLRRYHGKHITKKEARNAE